MDSKKILASALSAGIMLSGTGILQSIANAQATGSAYNVKDQSNQSKKNILETVGAGIAGVAGVGILVGALVHIFKIPSNKQNSPGTEPTIASSYKEGYVEVDIGEHWPVSDFLKYIESKRDSDKLQQGDSGIISISVSELKRAQLIKLINAKNGQLRGWLMFDEKQQKWVEIDPKMAATVKIGDPIPNASAASTPAPAGTTSVVPTVLPPADEAFNYCRAGGQHTSAVVIKREDANRYGASLGTGDKIPLWTTNVGNGKQLIDIAIGGYVKGRVSGPYEKGDGENSLRNWNSNQTDQLVQLARCTKVKIFVRVSGSWKENISLDEYLNNPNVTMSSAPAAPAPAAPAPAATAPAPAPAPTGNAAVDSDIKITRNPDGSVTYEDTLTPDMIPDTQTNRIDWKNDTGSALKLLEEVKYRRMTCSDATRGQSGGFPYGNGIENLMAWCSDAVNERIIRQFGGLKRKCTVYYDMLVGPGAPSTGSTKTVGYDAPIDAVNDLKKAGCGNVAVVVAANQNRVCGGPDGANTQEETNGIQGTTHCSEFSRNAYLYYSNGNNQPYSAGNCLLMEGVKYYPKEWLMKGSGRRWAVKPEIAMNPQYVFNVNQLTDVTVMAHAAYDFNKNSNYSAQEFDKKIRDELTQIYRIARANGIDGLVMTKFGTNAYVPRDRRQEASDIWDRVHNEVFAREGGNIREVVAGPTSEASGDDIATYYNSFVNVATRCDIINQVAEGARKSYDVLSTGNRDNRYSTKVDVSKLTAGRP